MSFQFSVLAKLLREQIMESCLQYGDFTLASGKKSHFYLDLRQLATTPRRLQLAAASLNDRLRDLWDAGALPRPALHLVGVADGGIPLVTAMLCHQPLWANHTGGWIRKADKQHGVGGLVVGKCPAYATPVLIEDVVSTGESSRKAMAAFKAETGREINTVVALLSRTDVCHFPFEEPVQFHRLFHMGDLQIKSPEEINATVQTQS